MNKEFLTKAEQKILQCSTIESELYNEYNVKRGTSKPQRNGLYLWG